MCAKDADAMANSVDPDQTASELCDQTASEVPDLGLHCLPRSICPKTYDHYGKSQKPLLLYHHPIKILTVNFLNIRTPKKILL